MPGVGSQGWRGGVSWDPTRGGEGRSGARLGVRPVDAGYLLLVSATVRVDYCPGVPH